MNRLSYWQRGCDDAKAGRPPATLHFTIGTYWVDEARRGYANGYRFGKEQGRAVKPGQGDSMAASWAAAKALAASMDYPWEFMTPGGQELMRQNAMKTVEAYRGVACA